ncbi:MAG: SusC/RagA family TonB-linked outer membrane protein [Saprospiraceae bacterium]|nr:SusC/RagA family TonB-linked outer membrane protein [Saprospiraceae bacterium]
MKQCLFTMLALLSFSFIQAQTVISGSVKDVDGEGIVGATILLTGTTQGTVTDISGNFTLENVTGKSASLTVSYIGYTTLTIQVDFNNQKRVSVDITLEQDVQILDNVVVVAYGTRKKEDLTGSVTSVGEKDFQRGNIATPEQLLTGKVAGLQVTSGGGSAGGGSRIRIRGGASLNASNDPLIVIDGVPVEGNGIAGSGNLLNTINSDDIESISVLKDASATALYGSRASNGVIIITTKKGTKGRLMWNFNTQLSISQIAKKVEVYDGDQIRSIINATGNQNYIKLLGTANTDWQDEIYRSAFGNNNNLSTSGSIGNIPFRASVGFDNQDGILKTNNFKRLSGSLNINPSFFDDDLKINIALKGSQTKNVWADEGAIGAAVSFDPTQPVHANNKFGNYFEWLQNENTVNLLATRNPVGLLELRDNTSTVNRFIGNIQADYRLPFFPDLHLMANVGMDKIAGSGTDLIKPESATNYQTGGRKVDYKQAKSNTLIDLSLYYEKSLGKNSSIDILAGHSYQDFYTDVYNYPAYSVTKDSIIPGTQPTFATDKPQFRLESYFGRVNLTLANKYLITGSIRRDASSKFSKDNRVGYFPAAAVAWKMREEFFKNSKVLSQLKLRLGYGVTGQQDIGSYYSYLPVYNVSSETAQYQFGNSYYHFLRPNAYDANIRWETTTTSNIGLDFGFANDRITGSVDFYRKKTKDLLSVVPVAPGSNFDITLLTNVGNMDVKGMELTVNTIPVKNENLIWSLGFNVTKNQSKITNLLRNQDPSFKGINVSGIAGGTGNTIGKFEVGYTPYTFFVYKQVYDSKTGAPIEGLYEDLNRDGQIDDNDRYLYTNPAPEFMLGINTQVIINKLSIGLAGHGSFNNYLYNNFASQAASLRRIEDPINYISNGSVIYDDTKFTNNQYLSDYFIENASFFRLDNINIGYNIGRIFRDKASLRLSANIQNVFVITKYRGLDPELASDSGVDNTIYPRPRIYSVGASLDF